MDLLHQILTEVREARKEIAAVKERQSHMAKTFNVETEWMSVSEAARKIGCQDGHIHKLCYQNKLTSRPKGKLRINRESVEKYLNS